MPSLRHEKCVACRRGAPTLTDAEMEGLRPQIPDWSVIDTDGVKKLQRTYTLPDFAAALQLTDRIGAAAEEEGHHPSILTEWGRVTVTWWTHKIGGLHRNDVIMAAKSDALAADPALT